MSASTQLSTKGIIGLSVCNSFRNLERREMAFFSASTPSCESTKGQSENLAVFVGAHICAYFSRVAYLYSEDRKTQYFKPAFHLLYDLIDITFCLSYDLGLGMT